MDTEFVSVIGPGVREVSDQSHLTQVSIGCKEDPQECPPTEEILQQVCKSS